MPDISAQRRQQAKTAYEKNMQLTVDTNARRVYRDNRHKRKGKPMRNYSTDENRKLAIQYYGKARAWPVGDHMRRAYLSEARYWAYRVKAAI